jgi:pyruvate formate lyase activating enzyme
MKKPPLIIDIKGNSLDDGPGIRSVIFFKGCPLSCMWCHNPESKKTHAEISFDPQKCIGCNTCIGECPVGVLLRSNPLFVDRENCTLCFDCVGKCPSGALSQVGLQMETDEIVEKILRDKPFFDASGGGVTFSGGEPTLNIEFLSKLLMAMKKSGIHTLIETCGHFKFEEFKESVLPYTDMIYMDIKLFDSKAHEHYCGVDNNVILKNFIKLYALSRTGGFEIIPRTPLIPGITDTEDNLASIALFLYEHQVNRIRLLPNNPVWHEKCFSIGIESPYRKDSPVRKWIPLDEFEAIKGIFEKLNIKS